ncbi:hypothetical protein Tco_1119732 [Tanacetum coccineum]
MKKTNYTPSPKDGVDGVDTEDGRNSDFVAGSIQPNDDARSNGDKGTYGNDRQHDGMPLLHSFASFLHAESSQNKVNFHTLETEQSDLADVLIPISSVLEVHPRFKNTLYGYFLSKKMAYPVVGSYILNAWKKYDVKRVMGDKMEEGGCSYSQGHKDWRKFRINKIQGRISALDEHLAVCTHVICGKLVRVDSVRSCCWRKDQANASGGFTISYAYRSMVDLLNF